MKTETTEIELTEDQEQTQIANIAKASILNIEKNKQAYEELRDEYTGIVLPEFKDPEFKKIHKKLTEGSGKLVKARTAADKLVKQEIGVLDMAKTMIKNAGEDLKAITADAEKEVKSLKETAEQLIEDDKQEQLRILEEKKQARMVELLDLGMTAKAGYYQLGDITVTQMELIQSTEAQWEGKVSQIKVVYEAEQLRISEEAEKAEALRKEQEAEQIRLANENEAKQKELDEAQRERDLMRLERTEHRVDVLKRIGFDGDLKVGTMTNGELSVKAAFIVDATKQEWEDKLRYIDNHLAELKNIQVAPMPVVKPLAPLKPLNGHQITPEQHNAFVEVMGQPDDEDTRFIASTLTFTVETPYIDAKMGKMTLRIYPELFLDEANEGLSKESVAASGEVNGELLFLVIKGK